MSTILWCFFISSGAYIVKCDGDVHVERFGILCSVVQYLFYATVAEVSDKSTVTRATVGSLRLLTGISCWTVTGGGKHMLITCSSTGSGCAQASRVAKNVVLH